MGKAMRYIQEAYDELLHKVTWPSWSALQQTTIIVIVALAITTLIILGMDKASEGVIKIIYGMMR